MPEHVHLLAADPAFADGISSAELHVATQVVVAEALRLEGGAIGAAGLDCARRDAVLLTGAITQEVTVGGRQSVVLYGPGDIIRFEADDESLVHHDVRWLVTEPTLLAVFGDRFWKAARRWPSLSETVNRRLHEQARRLALHLAIAQLGRVEDRILAVLWHLAERWGRVTPAGVKLGLRLTHETLGRLTGAQRPTVTLGLMALGSSGAVTRTPDGGWLLAHESLELLEPAGRVEAAPAPLRVVASGDGRAARRSGLSVLDA